MISNFKNFKNKKINTIFSKNSLSEDLKTIYKNFKTSCSFWNYIIYVNIEKKFNKNSLLKLLNKTVYNCYESCAYGEELKENFIINFKGNEAFKSTSLDKVENKPSITLIKLSKGTIADVDYLRKGSLITKNTQIEC